MRQQLKWTLLLILAVLLSACSESPPPLSPLPRNATILAFGDSLTYGTGAGPEESYPAVLQSLTGLTVINAGIPGETSTEGLKRLPELLQKYQPDLVVLCHGGNDMLRKQSLERLEQNLREMVTMAQSNGAEVLMVAVPKPNPMNIESPPLYTDVATEMALPLERDILAELLSSRQYKSDHIHPNAAGYRRLAESIQNILMEAGALQEGS